MRELREQEGGDEEEYAGSSQTTSESSENTRLPKADAFMENDTKTNFLCFQSDLQILLKAKEVEYAEAQAEIKGEST